MMALRQLLGVICLAIHFLTSSVGVYGVPDYSREPHVQPQDPIENSTGHIGSGIIAAATPSRLSTYEENLAVHTTPSSDQSIEGAGAILLARPRPFHVILHGGKAIPPSKGLLSSSSATITPTGVGPLVSTDNFGHVRGTTRNIPIASRNRSALASVYTSESRVVRLSDPRPDRALTTGYNKSSTPAWYPLKSTSAIPTTSSGSVIGGSKNASASLRSMATASGIGESPRLAEFLDSIKNRTESRKGLSPGFRSRPLDNRPVRLPLWSLVFEQQAASGVLVPTPALAKAAGSDRISSTKFNIAPLRTSASSALRNYLASTNNTRTEGRYPERVKPHKPSLGLSLLSFNTSTFNRTYYHQGVSSGGRYGMNCSGLVTSTANVVYEVVTSTILVNETITLGQNATTPSPVLVTPAPACQTYIAPCEGLYCPSSSVPRIGPIGLPKEPKHPESPPTPYTPSTTTSTLLVTKKSAAVVQQLSAVGNLFGPSTPIPPAVAAQPSSDGQRSAGQNAGPSNPEISTQSDGSSTPESDVDGQSPNESIPDQNPTNGNSPSASSNSQNSDSQKPGAGSNGGQSTKSDDETASNKNEPSGATSNHGDSLGNGDNVSSGGPNTGGGSSNGKMSNSGDASNEGGTPSNEGISDSGNTNAGGGISNNGGSSADGAASNSGKGSSDGDSPELEAGSSINSHGIEYVPSMAMAGNLPVSIVSNAVIVGSHTVKAGSPPTTVVANGQTIAIQSSQIVAQEQTIPIQAVVTQPASSATIGAVPVVLRPQDVAIGSKTFEHGSLPSSVIYNGQTYSWDASHLVGAGATVAFPTVDSAPRVTAGGQVFSVFPSQLKAPGKTIPLPHIATPSPFVYRGQTFSVNPSQIIAPDTSITLPPARKVTPFVYIDHTLSVDASHFMARSTTIPLSSGSGTVTYNGQVLTIKPSEIIGPSTTVALSAPDDSSASPTAVTTGGLSFSIGPSAAVFGSSTYSFVPGKAPATIVTHGEAVLVGSNGVQFQNIHVPIPTITPSFSVITQGDLAFSIAPSEVVVDGHTHIIHSDMTPVTTVVNGHSISIGPKGVGLASTTIPLPTPKPSFSMATKGGITFSVASSEVVVKGKTYSIASNEAPITTSLNGQIMTIGPKGIRIKGTTVDLPAIQTPKIVTAAGLSFLIGATDAVLSGTTYAIGSGALLQTVEVGSQTMKMGSAGVMFPSTTIAPEQTPVAVTADGLTFQMDSTEAVINGTAYAIGSGAMAKTIIEGSTTITLGIEGVVLPSTTIRPWGGRNPITMGLAEQSNAAQTSFSSFLGTSEALSAANATRPLTPIATGREGEKKHAAGISTRIPNSNTLLCLLLGVGTMMLGLSLI